MHGVILVGAGYWGKNYIAAVSDSPDLELTGVVDQNHSEIRIKGLVPSSIPLFDSLQVALGNVDTSIVVIATPVKSHFSLAMEAINVGKHVLVEKPLALTPEECESLVSTARDNGVTLQVGLNYFNHPCIVALDEFMDSRGKSFVSMRSQRFNPGPFREDTSIIEDLLPHDVSMALRLFRAKPESVHAISAKNDAFVSITFDGGQSLLVNLAWKHPLKSREVTLVADDLMAIFDELAPSGKQLEIQEYEDKRLGDNLSTVGVLNRSNLGFSEFMVLPDIIDFRNQPLISNLQNMVQSIEEKVFETKTALASIEIARVLEASELSIKSGERVRIK